MCDCLDDQTGKAESSCSEREPDSSSLSVIPVISSSEVKNSHPEYALPDAQNPSVNASHSGFDFLGSLAKSQSPEREGDDADDNNEETKHLDSDTSFSQVHKETSDNTTFSSTETTDADKPTKNERNANVGLVAKAHSDSFDVAHAPPCSPVWDKSATPPSSLKEQRVTKQGLPAATRKKKKKGIRPGHDQSDTTVSDLVEQPVVIKSADTDSLSLSSHGSSCDVTSATTSSLTMASHFAMGSQTMQESSAELPSNNRDVDVTVSKDADAAGATNIEERDQKESNGGDPDNRPTEEYKSCDAEPSGDLVNMLTSKNASDTVSQLSNSKKAMEVLSPQSASCVGSNEISSSQKLSDDLEDISLNPGGAGGNYQIELSAADKLTVLLEVTESNQDQLRLE